MTKPAHLSKAYGDQFQDQSIVDRYRKRPDYQTDVIEKLHAMLPANARVLDLGCGTGEVAIPLAERGHRVDGVDPSEAMIAKAQSLNASVNWVCAYAEDFEFALAEYDLIVTANSLHWMDWPVVFPLFAQALKPNGSMVVITGGEINRYAGQDDAMALVKQYSTNQDFQPFSLVDLICQAHHFKVSETFITEPHKTTQPVSDFIDSIHARNGFSYERMGEENAQEFDEKMAAVLKNANPDGVVGEVQSTLTIGQPIA